MNDKIGFLQTASGEKSSTKFFNTLYGIALIVVWVYLCWQKQEILPLDLTAIAPLGIGQIMNGVNKWIEVNGNSEKARMIKAIMAKVKK